MLNQLAQVNIIGPERPHIAHKFEICLKPEIHLLQHVLVDLAKDFNIVIRP